MTRKPIDEQRLADIFELHSFALRTIDGALQLEPGTAYALAWGTGDETVDLRKSASRALVDRVFAMRAVAVKAIDQALRLPRGTARAALDSKVFAMEALARRAELDPMPRLRPRYVNGHGLNGHTCLDGSGGY